MRTSRRSSLAGAGKIPGCPLGETMSIKQRFEREPIYLMDGSAFVYRGFYANQSMQRSDGFPTSALFIMNRACGATMVVGRRPFIVLGSAKSNAEKTSYTALRTTGK